MTQGKLRHTPRRNKRTLAATQGLVGNVNDVGGKLTGVPVTRLTPSKSTDFPDAPKDCRQPDFIGQEKFRHNGRHNARPFVVGRIAHGVYVAKLFPRPRGAR